MPKNAEQAWVDTLNERIQSDWDNRFLEERAQYWFESRDWIKDYEIVG